MTFNQNWSAESGESRTEEYRTWRTRAGFGAVGDVDQIEYLGVDGTPVLAIELCVADRRSDAHPRGIPPGEAPSRSFLDQVVNKVGVERAQGRLVRKMLQALEVPFLLVVFIKNELEAGVWVKRIDEDRPWRALTLAEYEKRLRRIHATFAARTQATIAPPAAGVVEPLSADEIFK